MADVHARVALLGFLGLAIVGVRCLFSPAAVASVPGFDDRTAGAAAALVIGGSSSRSAASWPITRWIRAGRWIAVRGVLCYAFVLFAVFAERR